MAAFFSFYLLLSLSPSFFFLNYSFVYLFSSLFFVFSSINTLKRRHPMSFLFLFYLFLLYFFPIDFLIYIFLFFLYFSYLFFCNFFFLCIFLSRCFFLLSFSFLSNQIGYSLKVFLEELSSKFKLRKIFLTSFVTMRQIKICFNLLVH